VSAVAANGKISVSVQGLALSYGPLQVLKSLDLDIPEGEFLVLLGPSGCGKSTLLNCIAGLLEPSEGKVFIKGRNVTWEEPKDRGIGMVFQSYALYPQMTVEKNLSFGLRVSGMARDEIAKRVKRAAEILQIEPLLERKPMQLSGGQRQRVAIGRALVRDVDVFLFDEPLSNLDAKLRSELRVEIKRLHQKLSNTMIYVTHDQIEAMTLADRIAIMKGGTIQQLAPPQEVYNRPGNRYVAEFIGSPGMNFIGGTLTKGSKPMFSANGLSIDCSRYAFDGTGPVDGKADFGIRPEHVLHGSAAARLPARLQAEVELVEPMGSDMLVWTKAGPHALTFIADSNEKISVGERRQIGFDPARASIFSQETGTRL
jgi:multiple sugar transport system ATP-binding protein